MSSSGPSSEYLDLAVADAGVALITSAHRGRGNVMTASFFAESSHLPVLLRVAISPTTLTHELVLESGWFGLSVLSEGQESLAMECGTCSGREGPKLDRLGLDFIAGPEGLPLLTEALATSACRVVETVDIGGDHTLFVGEVVESFRQPRRAYRDPLLVSTLVRRQRTWRGR